MSATGEWMLVPREPTSAMKEALLAEYKKHPTIIPDAKAAAWDSLCGYRAMLTAVPEPSDDLVERLCWFLYKGRGQWHGHGQDPEYFEPLRQRDRERMRKLLAEITKA